MASRKAHTAPTPPHDGRKGPAPYQHPSKGRDAPQGHSRARGMVRYGERRQGPGGTAWCWVSHACNSLSCPWRVGLAVEARAIESGGLLAYRDYGSECRWAEELGKKLAPDGPRPNPFVAFELFEQALERAIKEKEAMKGATYAREG